ncbi:MAG: DUF4468 domain-containing protein [Microcystis sp. LE19-251.1A]|nr:DUF4468 domain-containing protein [Microcystis sp. LE19-251.1A]
MNKIAILFFSLVVFGNCVSLLPKEQRAKEKVFDSKNKSQIIYERAKVFFVKETDELMSGINFKHTENNRIVIPTAIKCVLSPYGAAVNGRVKFKLDFIAKDFKYKIRFEDILVQGINQSGAYIDTQYPDTLEHLEYVYGQCLTPFEDGLFKAIEGAKSKEDLDF